MYYSLGNIYRVSGNLSAAQKYYTKSIELATKLRTEKRVLRSYLGLANVFIDQCAWHEAEKVLKDIITICTEKEYPIILALATSSLGNLYCRRGHYEKALQYHQDAFKLLSQSHFFVLSLGFLWQSPIHTGYDPHLFLKKVYKRKKDYRGLPIEYKTEFLLELLETETFLCNHC